MKRDSQYQDKSVQDWTTHLEYLQSILIKFDPNCASEESTMIWYFQKGLRLSLRVEIEQCGWELDSFKEIVEKTVNIKAKAPFRPRSYACDINQHCFRDSRPSAAKTSTQGQSMKDSRVEKPKPRSQEQKPSAPKRSNNIETCKQAWKKKKKKEKRERRNQERRHQDTTPATEVNIINTLRSHSSGV